VWSFWLTRGERSRTLIAALAIPVLAYGLTAFWLSPSYLRVTLRNMAYVSNPGSAWSVELAAVVAVAYGFATYKLAARRKARTWAVFVIGALVVFTLDVAGNHFWNFRVMGEPGRLVPELDLVLILGLLLPLEWLWQRPGPWLKAVVAALLLTAFATSRHYIRHSRELIQRWPDYQARVEYRVTDYLWTHMPQARVFTSGTVRFWYDDWHDLEEMGGGSDQGLLNPVVPDVEWEMVLGTEPEPVLLWSQAMGVDVMYASDAKSEEPYRDIQYQGRFAQWPLLWDDGQGNRLWSTQRRFPAHARVVETSVLNSLPRLNDRNDIPHLRPYVDMLERGPDSPVTMERPSTDSMVLHASIVAGQSLLVQESWDPAWRATVNGHPAPVTKDEMGFMVVHAPPGNDTIRLDFPMPLENRFGWGLTGFTVAALAFLATRKER